MPIPELSGGPRNAIRSYELRQGRLTDGQRRALDRHWQEYGVNPAPGVLDLDSLFRRRAPRVLDVGSGMGDTVAAVAAANPGSDFLALEVHLPGVGALVRRAAAEHLGNLRVMRADAMEVIRHRLPEASLDEVWVLFPDPWLKRRQHKRRLVNAEFAGAVSARLKPGGALFLATDIPELGEHMLHVCDAEPALVNLAGHGRFAPRPCWRPRTKFEQRGLRLGHELRDLVYVRGTTPVISAANESTDTKAARYAAVAWSRAAERQ